MKSLSEKVRSLFSRSGSLSGSEPLPQSTAEQHQQQQLSAAAGSVILAPSTSASAVPTSSYAPAPQEELPARCEAAASEPSKSETQAHAPLQATAQTTTSAPTPAPASNKMDQATFFSELPNTEANRYTIREVIGKGSYGTVCSAVDNYTGEKVAIKKITNVFEHVSDATRILREIKLLRLLKHPDIVEIKHIMLPPTCREFKDIYVVFELLETDLHQVIKANDDLTPEHHQFFLYQMLRGLKYIHSAKVFHRDLKPKNILANSDCKLKICDFGLARPAFDNLPTTVFWTDYVATRWYRAPELCGSFFAKYSPSIDTWSIGCIFAEVLLGKPLFPGRNVVHQLELITDLLGSPSAEVINKVRNEKARRFLTNMRRKPGVPFEQHFPRADKVALLLLHKLLAFDPADRPTSEEALADPYFAGLHSVSREPVAQPLSRMAFEFDRRKLTLEDVRDLIYREILEYHPAALSDYVAGIPRNGFVYPSALDSFKRQFMACEGQGLMALPKAVAPSGTTQRIHQAQSLPKEWVADFQQEAAKYMKQGPGGHAVDAGSAAIKSTAPSGEHSCHAAAVAAYAGQAAAMAAGPSRPPGGGLYRSEPHHPAGSSTSYR
ncbi:MAG: hypothetical protein WDW36_001806 [Sanguina aurantia]